MTADVPWELRRRLTTWERLDRDHGAGRAHHDVLCATPDSCRVYGKVIRAQVELLRRAVALPSQDQLAVAESLSTPGLSSLRALVEKAEQRQSVTR